MTPDRSREGVVLPGRRAGAFRDVHDGYVECWRLALASGDAAAVEEYLAEGYHGWFAASSTRSVPYDRDEAIEGMRDSVAGLCGAALRAEHRVVALRGDGEAVVSYQKLIERDGDPVASAIILEAWRDTETGWLLEREFTEHAASVAQPS